jgi:hypothetical protein
MRNALLLLALLLASNVYAQNFYNQTGPSIGRMDTPPPAFTPFAHPAVRFNK